MESLTTLRALLFPDGILGRVAFVAFAWTLAASVLYLLASLKLLHRFSREGPVLPLLLPELEKKWEAASFRMGIWLWLRRLGIAVLFLAFFLTIIQIGMYLHSVLAAGLVEPDWYRAFSTHLRRLFAVLLLLALGLFSRIVLGGPATLLTIRAHNFVTASSSLVSPQDVERARRYLDGISDAPPGGDSR